jgi:hypothetical protein
VWIIAACGSPPRKKRSIYIIGKNGPFNKPGGADQALFIDF